MATIKQNINRMNSVKKRLPLVAKKAVLAKKDFILSLLKHDQLGEGLDSSGRVVGEYAASTEEVWAKIPPKPRTAKVWGTNYNFEWTGKFFDTMRLKADRDGFDIISSRKAELENIYKTQLTKLSPENMEFVEEKVIEEALYDEIFATLNSFI